MALDDMATNPNILHSEALCCDGQKQQLHCMLQPLLPCLPTQNGLTLLRLHILERNNRGHKNDGNTVVALRQGRLRPPCVVLSLCGVDVFDDGLPFQGEEEVCAGGVCVGFRVAEPQVCEGRGAWDDLTPCERAFR